MKSCIMGLVMVAMVGTAHAGSSDAATGQARAHFQKGSTFYKQARYREAIDEFQAAYKAKPHGVIFFNLAQCYEKMGDISNALRSYHEYMRQVPNAEDRAVVQEAVDNLEKRLAEKGVQQLLVYSEPPGAQVSIDGTAKGKTPFSVELARGPHKVAIAKDGYKTVERDLMMSSDKSVELDFALEPAATKAEPVVATAPPAVKAADAPKVEMPPPPPSLKKKAEEPKPATAAVAPGVEKSAPSKHGTWTWVALGAGGGGLALGAVFGLSALSASNNYLSAKHDQATAQKLHDQASTSAGAANGFFVLGGVAAAVGTTLFFMEGGF